MFISIYIQWPRGLKTSVTLGLDGGIKLVDFQVLNQPCIPEIIQLSHDG